VLKKNATNDILTTEIQTNILTWRMFNLSTALSFCFSNMFSCLCSVLYFWGSIYFL
jgi:hypothetical protein